jgi:hypothetical protein
VQNLTARVLQVRRLITWSKIKVISYEEKIMALNEKQDARQMLTASNEGMPGSDEGTDPSDHHMLGQVERAKRKFSPRSTQKATHRREHRAIWFSRTTPRNARPRISASLNRRRTTIRLERWIFSSIRRGQRVMPVVIWVAFWSCMMGTMTCWQ